MKKLNKKTNKKIKKEQSKKLNNKQNNKQIIMFLSFVYLMNKEEFSNLPTTLFNIDKYGPIPKKYPRIIRSDYTPKSEVIRVTFRPMFSRRDNSTSYKTLLRKCILNIKGYNIRIQFFNEIPHKNNKIINKFIADFISQKRQIIIRNLIKSQELKKYKTNKKRQELLQKIMFKKLYAVISFGNFKYTKRTVYDKKIYSYKLKLSKETYNLNGNQDKKTN